jgi:hypothetical protein
MRNSGIGCSRRSRIRGCTLICASGVLRGPCQDRQAPHAEEQPKADSMSDLHVRHSATAALPGERELVFNKYAPKPGKAQTVPPFLEISPSLFYRNGAIAFQTPRRKDSDYLYDPADSVYRNMLLPSILPVRPRQVSFASIHSRRAENCWMLQARPFFMVTMAETIVSKAKARGVRRVGSARERPCCC